MVVLLYECTKRRSVRGDSGACCISNETISLLPYIVIVECSYLWYLVEQEQGALSFSLSKLLVQMDCFLGINTIGTTSAQNWLDISLILV